MAMLSRSEAEELLYQEARLVDERRFDEWLAMFTRDAIYWVPSNGEGRDPAREVAIVYDDMTRLAERITRLKSGLAHAQNPASATRRLISNVEVEAAKDGEASVVSSFFIYELRRHKDRIFAGRYYHRFRQEEGRWKIAYKKAVLANNDEVIDNLTFFV